MDVQMPEMDGFEATAAIRDREKTTDSHIPIVAMTAHAMKGDRERCLAAGMDAYLSKPLRGDELFRVVEGLMASTATLPAETPAKPATQAGDGVCDQAAALERVDGDLDLLKELIGLFLEECPRWIAELREAIDAGQANRLRLAAHGLKGAVGNLGAPAVFEAAWQLELIGRHGNLHAAPEAYARLVRELERLRPALTILADSCSTSGSSPSKGG
jgi:CheY-like chemotaxis protein